MEHIPTSCPQTGSCSYLVSQQKQKQRERKNRNHREQNRTHPYLLPSDWESRSLPPLKELGRPDAGPDSFFSRWLAESRMSSADLVLRASLASSLSRAPSLILSARSASSLFLTRSASPAPPMPSSLSSSRLGLRSLSRFAGSRRPRSRPPGSSGMSSVGVARPRRPGPGTSRARSLFRSRSQRGSRAASRGKSLDPRARSSGPKPASRGSLRPRSSRPRSGTKSGSRGSLLPRSSLAPSLPARGRSRS